MRLKISHTTQYQYDVPLQYGLQQVRLTPKSRAGQSILNWETVIEGGKKEVEFEDQHNNHVLLVSVDPDCTEISIRCAGEVETTNADGIIGKHGGYAPLWFFNRSTALTEPGKNIKALVKELGTDFVSDVARLHSLSSLISTKVSYETGLTHSETTAEDALIAGHGVCQDHSHIFWRRPGQWGSPPVMSAAI